MSSFGYESHSFLNEFIRQNKCQRIMEIGVENGENARNMLHFASKYFPASEVEYYGFDTFGWRNNHQMNCVKQKLEKIGCQFTLFRGDSVQTLPQIVKKLPMMDLIFIDGDHSYPTVKSDWENSTSLMHEKTAVFFHNYNFSGPKKVVDNIPRTVYHVTILDPPRDYPTALVKKKI